MSVKIDFQVEYYTNAKTIAMDGSLRELGLWEPRKAVFAEEKENGKWEATVLLPRDLPFQYKWIVLNRHDNSVIRWEERENRDGEFTSGVNISTTWNFGHEILDSEDKQDVDGQDTSALSLKARDSMLLYKSNRTLGGPSPKHARYMYTQTPFDEDAKCARDIHQPAFAKDLNKLAEGPNTPLDKEIIEHPCPEVKVWDMMLLTGMCVMLGCGFCLFYSGVTIFIQSL